MDSWKLPEAEAHIKLQLQPFELQKTPSGPTDPNPQPKLKCAESTIDSLKGGISSYTQESYRSIIEAFRPKIQLSCCPWFAPVVAAHGPEQGLLMLAMRLPFRFGHLVIVRQLATLQTL